jgi:hypothetical protein
MSIYILKIFLNILSVIFAIDFNPIVFLRTRGEMSGKDGVGNG